MTDVVTKLKKLLDTERNALRAGDLKGLHALVDEKSALTDQIASEQPASERLRQLRTTLDEHAQLIRAAQAGVVDVLERLKAQKVAREGLQTYDRNGRASQIGKAETGTQRRF